jgi:hypothetical protein
MHAHGPGFNPGDGEQIIDDAGNVRGLASDQRHQSPRLFRIEPLPCFGEFGGESENGRQRRPQFVADTRQKVSLVMIEGLKFGNSLAGKFSFPSRPFYLEASRCETGASFGFVRVEFPIEAVELAKCEKRSVMVADPF